MKQARLALEESLGVERVVEAKYFVVEVVADFVEKRTQKSSESDNLLVLCRAHPDGQARSATTLGGFV